MGTPQPLLPFSFEDYLAWEEKQAERHEFMGGETFAMTGARRVHNLVAGNLYAAIKHHLRGTACRAFVSDMKLRLAESDAVFYPDVMVSCDSGDLAADCYLEHPRLIVEVLSESTAAYDRGDKFAAYRKSENLQEFVIVDIDARRVECYRRTADNHWLLSDYAGDDDCRFDSLDLTLPLSVVFEDLE
jgi:Uma2 family endonuclease